MAENIKENELYLIEFNVSMEYRDGEVYINKMDTGEMPANLFYKILADMNDNIREYYMNKSIREKNKED